MLKYKEWLETRLYYGPKYDPIRRQEIFKALNSDERLFNLYNALSKTKAGMMKFDEPLPGYKNGVQRLDVDVKMLPIPNEITSDGAKLVLNLSNKLEPHGSVSYDATKHMFKVSEI